MRRTKRRTYKNMRFQGLWDFCAQKKTSEIPKTHFQSTCLGQLRCLVQNFFGNPNKIHFQEFWDSCAQNKTSEISKMTLLGIMRFLYAEQNVGHLNKCTFKNSGTPVRRPKRRKSKKCTFTNSRTSVRRTKRRKSQQMHFP